MDEMRMVRELYGDQGPPRPAVVARARARLTKRRSPVKRVGLAAVAAAAAVGVVVASAVLNLGDKGGLPSVPTRLDARSVLLAAADRTEQEAPATGRYRYSKTEGAEAHVLGPKSDRYVVETIVREEVWRSEAGDCVTRYQELGTNPQSETDRAAWRRDGSPRVWRVERQSYPPGYSGDLPYRTTPGPVKTDPIGPCDPVWWDKPDVLPADPAELRDALLRRINARDPRLVEEDGRLRNPTDAEMAGFIWYEALSLLHGGNERPELRAAAFRLLAEMPGVKALGQGQVVRGRIGTVLSNTIDQPGPAVRESRVVIDVARGRVLGTETTVVTPGGGPMYAWATAGTRIHWSVLLEAGWTNSRP